MGLMDKMADTAKKTGGTVVVNPFTGTSIKYPNKKTGNSGGSDNSSSNTSTNNYAAQSAAYDEAERRRKEQEERAKRAYNSNMAALSAAYARRADALKQNYDSTTATLGRTYDTSKTNVNNQADQALKEAYINKMLSQRNLAQNMAAQGISGGLSETTQAGLMNNYGNARNNIETVRGSDLTSLENTYQNNLASALQKYNGQLAEDAAQRAQYEIQLRNDLENSIANSYTSMYSQIPSLTEAYTAKMDALLKNQEAFKASGQSAGNAIDPVSVESSIGGYDYASEKMPGTKMSYLEYAQMLQNAGSDTEHIANALANWTNNSAVLNEVLKQLYGGN